MRQQLEVVTAATEYKVTDSYHAYFYIGNIHESRKTIQCTEEGMVLAKEFFTNNLFGDDGHQLTVEVYSLRHIAGVGYENHDLVYEASVNQVPFM